MATDTEQQNETRQEAPVMEQNHTEEQSEGARLLNSMLHDEDGDNSVQHLRELFSVLSIDGTWFRKQVPLLILILFGLILYVTNGYQAQQEILREAQLGDSLKDWKYRCLTKEGELTRRTRQSQLESQLKAMGDSTLLPTSEPPFLLTDQ